MRFFNYKENFPLPQNLVQATWQFEKPFTSLIFNVEGKGFSPATEDNNPIGVFWEIYQGFINGRRFSIGIKTHMMSQQQSLGSGVVFEQWGTQNEEFMRPSRDGIAERSSFEGEKIGVRKCLRFHLDRFTLKLEPGLRDSHTIWYNLIYTDGSGEEVDCGGLGFSLLQEQNQGISDSGTTTSRLYKVHKDYFTRKDVPKSDITIYNPIADQAITGKCINLISPFEGLKNISSFRATASGINILTGPDVTI